MSRLMEKLAARAWKKNIDVVDRHPEYRKRLEDSKILDYKRETDGLNKGTLAIAAKHNIPIEELKQRVFDRNPEAKDIVKKLISFKSNEDFAKAGDKASPGFAEIYGKTPRLVQSAARHISKALAVPVTRRTTGLSHGFVTNSETGTIYKGDITRKLPRYTERQLKRMVKSSDPQGVGLQQLRETAKKDNQTKDYINALFLRHEADEGRSVKSGKTDESFKSMHGHVSPRVIERESANIAGAPQSVRDNMKLMRTPENDTIGFKKGFQYGKSGKDRKSL